MPLHLQQMQQVLDIPLPRIGGKVEIPFNVSNAQTSFVAVRQKSLGSFGVMKLTYYSLLVCSRRSVLVNTELPDVAILRGSSLGQHSHNRRISSRSSRQDPLRIAALNHACK
jgi:hypothetical protein